MVLHDSHDPFFRSPQGALPCGVSLRLRLKCDFAAEAFVRTWDGREAYYPMAGDHQGHYEAVLQAPEIPMLWWYDFLIRTGDGDIRYGNAQDQMGGEGALYPGTPPSFQVTVYDPGFTTPEFLHHGTIYQIFPDRFFHAPSVGVSDRKDVLLHKSWDEEPLVRPDPRSGDNTALDFFGGTLNGISEKLPYLKDLGITVLYLNPVFMARTNHKYDTGDYARIDPMFGTEEEFARLCRLAAGQGIRVLLDGVFSHTGEDSAYFNRYGTYASVGAYQSETSPYFPWYTFEEHPSRYRCWWGIPSLPEVRKEEATYRAFLFEPRDGIVPRWLHNGASGWRLDVADELPMPFLRELRQAAKGEKADAAVLGEVWEDASNKVSYGQLRSYCLGDTLDSVMNYPLREEIIAFLTGESSAFRLARLIRHQQEAYPVPFQYALMNLLGSHDRPRILNVLTGCPWDDLPQAEAGKMVLTREQYRLGAERLLKGYRILCALPGAPSLYYGDEAGMQGAADPFNRRTFPWGREDRELQASIRALFRHRLQSVPLKTGFLKVWAEDPDTVVIHRWTANGRDALGQNVPDGEETILIRR